MAVFKPSPPLRMANNPPATPSNDPKKIVNRAPLQPRNAPIIAMSLMSPPPNPSTPVTLWYAAAGRKGGAPPHRPPPRPAPPREQGEPGPGERLHSGIAPGDRVSATRAPPPQEKEAYERDVLRGADGAPAGRAAGGGADNRFLPGQPVNEDVEETAYARPHEECRGREKERAGSAVRRHLKSFREKRRQANRITAPPYRNRYPAAPARRTKERPPPYTTSFFQLNSSRLGRREYRPRETRRTAHA